MINALPPKGSKEPICCVRTPAVTVRAFGRNVLPIGPQHAGSTGAVVDECSGARLKAPRAHAPFSWCVAPLAAGAVLSAAFGLDAAPLCFICSTYGRTERCRIGMDNVCVSGQPAIRALVSEPTAVLLVRSCRHQKARNRGRK